MALYQKALKFGPLVALALFFLLFSHTTLASVDYSQLDYVEGSTANGSSSDMSDPVYSYVGIVFDPTTSNSFNTVSVCHYEAGANGTWRLKVYQRAGASNSLVGATLLGISDQEFNSSDYNAMEACGPYGQKKVIYTFASSVSYSAGEHYAFILEGGTMTDGGFQWSYNSLNTVATTGWFSSDKSGFMGGGGTRLSLGINNSEPSCTDGIKNQDETGVDTGGVCTPPPPNPADYINSQLDSSGSHSQNADGQVIGSFVANADMTNPDASLYLWTSLPEGNGSIVNFGPCSYFLSGNYVDGGYPNGSYPTSKPLTPNTFHVYSQCNLIKDTQYNITLSGGNYGTTYSIAMNADGTEPYYGLGKPEAPTVAHNPVLIIPGVLGTEMFNGSEKLWLDFDHNLSDKGDQFMDPLQFNENLTPSVDGLTVGDVIHKVIGHLSAIKLTVFNYTSELIKEFNNQGYIEDTDLFLFSYDWRYGVSDDTVLKLKQKISDILTKTGAEKIDVIAHSTGGLLIKKYVIENPSNHNVDKAIFVGVPNTGAPQAIKDLLLGSSFSNPFLDPVEMKKIAKNLPVVYDLTPSQQYYDAGGSYVRTINTTPININMKDLNFEETDDFLLNGHSLNSEALDNAHNLHSANFDNYDLRTNGVDLYAINGCKAGTLNKITERKTQGLGESNIGYELISVRGGDGTVPLVSATNLPIDQEHRYFALKTEHSKMLSQNGIRQKIVNIITGSNLDADNITADITKCKLNGRAIAVYSPVNIDVTDQDGNHAGLSLDGDGIENNIPNAYFDILGEHKFVYLPDDEGQSYNIVIHGTGEGLFTITDTKIEDDQEVQMQVFRDLDATSSLSGEIHLGDTTTLDLDNDNDGSIDKNLTPNLVLDAESLKDFDPTHQPKKNETPPEDTGDTKNSSVDGHSSGGGKAQPSIPSSEITLGPEDSTIPDEVKSKSNNLPTSTPQTGVVEDKTLRDMPIPESNSDGATNLGASATSSGVNIRPWTILITIFGLLIIIFVAKRLKKG